MEQLLRKCALVTVGAILALGFTARSAHAQAVTVVDDKYTFDLDYPLFSTTAKVGDHLFFTYWSTANSTDTHVNIHAPFGVRNSMEDKDVVHVRVRSNEADFDNNTVVSFNICLMPGDSWTAALSSEGLRVVDPGECDDDVHQNPDTRTVTHIATPAAGEMVSLGDTTEGFIEAWLRPIGGLVDDAVPCTQAEIDDTDNDRCEEATAVAGGPDPDVMPDNSVPWYIRGTATLVSAISGFSSSYNASAFIFCDVAGSEDPDDTTGDGCWTVNTADDNANMTAADATNVVNGITTALTQAAFPYALIGRWTAIADENVTSHTKLVLTFAGGNHLLYKGLDKTDPDYRAEVEGVDPLSVYVFDDMGQIALRTHELELDQAVNTCRFMQPMGDSMMDGDMEMADDMPPATSSMLSCNGMEVGEIDAVSGGFRIFNNTAVAVADRNPADGSSPEAGGSRLVSSTGAENEGIGNMDDPNTPTVDEDAQTPAEPLAVLGLIFSYFEGTDGSQYDQVTEPSTLTGNTPGQL